MLDDEVVFLGSSSGKQSSCTNYPQVPHRPVTGIILHVEKQSAPGTGCRMLFRKATTSVVHIGRRSGLEADTTHLRSRDHEQDSAMFRCAVVSRKHARIAFSDSGHAYLIDLSSHHGTFVRKPGEKFSKMIKPETSTMLADGDIVTFGKSVGKGDETVMPIVARIELLHAGSNPGTSDILSTLFKPLVVPSSSSLPFTPDRHNLKSSSSGRYGIHTSSSSSSSSSDESYCSHSPVVYSDIEEIPPPTTNLKASTSQSKIGVDKNSTEDNERDNVKDGNSNNASSSQGSGSLGQALNVLRRFLPPSQPPLSQVSSFFFGPESKPPSEPSVCSTPPFDVVHPHSLSQSNERLQQNQASISVSSDPITDPNPDESRSSSPMDLGSPASAPADDFDEPTSAPGVSNSPDVSAAPRVSPPPSLSPTLPPILQLQASNDVHLPAPAPDRMNIPLVNSPDGGASSRRSPVQYRYITPPDVGLLPYIAPQYLGERDDYPFVPDEPLHPREFVLHPYSASTSALTSDRVKDVEGSIENLKAEVAKLHAHRRKYKARFNSNVQVISEKLGSFDDRLLEVNAEYIVLSNQVERIQEVDLAEMTSHLEVLQDNVDEAADEREDAVMEVEENAKEREEIKATIAELGQAVAELKSFRDDMKKQLDEQLVQMKALHDTAIANIATQQAQHLQTQALIQQCQEMQGRIQAQNAGVQTPVLTSLKRKRDDTDENEEVENEKHDDGDIDGKSEISKTGDLEMTSDGEPAAITTTTSTSGSSSGYVIDGDAPGAEGESASDVVVAVVDDDDDVDLRGTDIGAHDAKVHISDAPPPRKRARRFVKVVAQTATAVTVGAVVTWSALAFS